uniref:Site-1 protease n=1 Tax=Beta vulgaris TaxID=161934 RepID=I6TC17_BETVU|nr:site-1 protease [Beta vulgaris]
MVEFSRQGKSSIAAHHHLLRFRFSDYKDAKFQQDYLRHSIEFDGWEWSERRNSASNFSTDFGVVSIEESVEIVVIGEIERLNKVKVVSVDLSCTNNLLKEDKLEKESEFRRHCQSGRENGGAKEVGKEDGKWKP